MATLSLEQRFASGLSLASNLGSSASTRSFHSASGLGPRHMMPRDTSRLESGPASSSSAWCAAMTSHRGHDGDLGGHDAPGDAHGALTGSRISLVV